MKYLTQFSLLFFSLCLFIACAEDSSFTEEIAETNIISYFIFGEYYGECGDNCANLYRIREGELHKDNILFFNPSQEDEDIIFITTAYPEEYLLAKPLLDSLPDSLFLTEGSVTTFGCPDCADQGGLILSLERNNIKSRWLLDTNENEWPEFLLPYGQQLKQVLLDLQ